MQFRLSRLPHLLKKYLVIALFCGMFHIHETHKLSRKYFRDFKREYSLNFDDNGNLRDGRETNARDNKRQSKMDEFVHFQNNDETQQTGDVVNDEDS